MSASSRPTWNSRSSRSRDEVADGRPALGVGHRGDACPGLVQREVDQAAGGADAHPVDADDVGLGVDAPALLARRPRRSTDTRPSPMSTSQARREPMPGGGEHLLQADALVVASCGPCGRLRSWARRRRARSSVGQERRERRQLVERAQPEPLEQQVGRAVQRRRAVRVVPGLRDQAAGEQRAHDAVDVDAADRADPRPGDRLAVGDDGERLERGLRQPGRLPVQDEPLDVRRAVRRGCRAASRRPPRAARSPRVACGGVLRRPSAAQRPRSTSARSARSATGGERDRRARGSSVTSSTASTTAGSGERCGHGRRPHSAEPAPVARRASSPVQRTCSSPSASTWSKATSALAVELEQAEEAGDDLERAGAVGGERAERAAAGAAQPLAQQRGLLAHADRAAVHVVDRDHRLGARGRARGRPARRTRCGPSPSSTSGSRPAKRGSSDDRRAGSGPPARSAARPGAPPPACTRGTAAAGRTAGRAPRAARGPPRPRPARRAAAGPP